jgi:hypothetical protein
MLKPRESNVVQMAIQFAPLEKFVMDSDVLNAVVMQHNDLIRRAQR